MSWSSQWSLSLWQRKTKRDNCKVKRVGDDGDLQEEKL
jgi:hypothetical protein